jgi:cellulose synthase/poly-beta-1,6-N-acetylglucosamine synthase-like glycosyltransferase
VRSFFHVRPDRAACLIGIAPDEIKGHASEDDMTAVLLLFWTSLGCIAYTYAGYPLVLMVISGVRQLRTDWRHVSTGRTRRVARSQALPRVAVLVAAFNEERHIEQRIRNVLEQDYPADRLRIYVGSDCSSDRTGELVRSFNTERLTFADFKDRRGKPSVINDLAAMATEEILVLTDANTFFAPDTVSNLVRHFDEPDVGCVCGELRLVGGSDKVENQDHIYWRYERLLKFFESRIDALLGANGGVYALRRTDYTPIPARTIVDDFWISMEIIESGRRCVYDPEAVATEEIPARIGDEFRRRVRIGIGNYQAFVRFTRMLDPRRGWVALSFLSHKCMRWLVPHFMLTALACNVLLLDRGLYAALFIGQLLFYLGAWVGWRYAQNGMAPKLLRIPLFFVSMNLGLLVGFWKFATGGVSGVWARSAR